ncbi:XrtA/PEP-CTERM system-associated ATPase [uncultured Pseudodesulfovibrio sp.]|uniref:XrtA/PEP-CTERM system-associated ATPase n=1 Tax=uncultured Pseudodesulfovibrio sp. TaxID=2035858 RepID=UPI0029C88E42|nr:XrtA/PEP-CTERM system-associated ATPase [uncultured Pseudodesulfovibrio sp.]
MYEEFFNFRSKPFDLLPNPDMLFMSRSHGKALSYLRYGIEERVGFILLSGEVGAGKTTLIRELIKRHLDNVTLAKIFNTKADSQQLLTMINDDFGLETDGRSKAALLRDLNEFLIDQYAEGKRAVLIIDEAQNLSTDLLEEIRMLSNLETDGGKLLQIVLVGQPELRDTLNSPELLQLRQRIQIGCHLKPLNREEVSEYIYYRMESAGNREAVFFAPEALDLIHDLSRGVPRLINILCDYLLLDAFASEKKDIAGEDVSAIAEELDFERQYWQGAQEQSAPAASMRRARKMPKRASQVLKTINDLGNRLDMLERSTSHTDQNHAVMLMDKLEAVEKKLQMLESDMESVKAMYWNKMAQQKMEATKPAENEGKRPGKRGWAYRLLFGGE